MIECVVDAKVAAPNRDGKIEDRPAHRDELRLREIAATVATKAHEYGVREGVNLIPKYARIFQL